MFFLWSLPVLLKTVEFLKSDKSANLSVNVLLWLLSGVYFMSDRLLGDRCTIALV